MLRPLITLSAAALMVLGNFAVASAQPRPPGQPPGRPPGPPPNIQPQQQFRPGQTIQNPNSQFQWNLNRGSQWNQNRGWNQNWGWNDPTWSNRWGNGASIWFQPYGAWNVPMSGRYGPSYILPPPAVVPVELVGREYGLQITEVFDGGGAKSAQLRAGDIILGVGKTRTQSFEALQAALVGIADADIVFVNRDNNRVERMPVKVDNGKIGVAVIPVAMQ